MNRLIEKLGENLYCENCGVNYNYTRRRAGTIYCADLNTTHVYAKRDKMDNCPNCGVTMNVYIDHDDDSGHLQCWYCNHREDLVRIDELPEGDE